MPGICTKFAECYKGSSVIKDCPPGTHFCVKSLMCDWPSKAVCDQVTKSVSQSTSIVREESTVSTSNESGGNSAYQSQNNDQANEVFWSGEYLKSRIKLEIIINEFNSDVILARNIDVLPAPPSGQTVRLRQGRSPAEGYLELVVDGEWGYVCDDGWSMQEADLVCRQLGYSRGVKKTTTGLVYGPVDQSKRSTEDVNCHGHEERIEDCQLTAKGESARECKLSEDIVSVVCLYDSFATCRTREIPYGDSCYRVFTDAKSFHDAQDICMKNDMVLVEIESQEENDLISEMLFQSSLTTTSMDQVWTGGVGSFIARKNVWFWHSNTEKVMEFRNFWRGWSGGDRLDLDDSKLESHQYQVYTHFFVSFL